MRLSSTRYFLFPEAGRLRGAAFEVVGRPPVLRGCREVAAVVFLLVFLAAPDPAAVRVVERRAGAPEGFCAGVAA